METRNMNRRRRADPPASAPHPPPARGSARQTAASNSTNPAVTPQEVGRRRGLRPASEDSKLTGPATIPIPRRGAPGGRDAASVASIRTVPPRGDESQLGEEDRESMPPPAINQEAEATRRNIMELTLLDLSNATDELMQRLEHTDIEDPVLRRLIQIKFDAFSSVRESFEEEQTSPLIDWAQAGDIWNDDEFPQAVAIMVRANIATALQVITSLEAGKQLDLLTILEKFNTHFPQLFIVSEDMFEHPELLLDIRTWYLIEVLNSADVKLDEIYALIASVFCEPAEGRDFLQRFTTGPFKGLGAAEEDRLEELVSERITAIISITKKDKKTHGVSQLKQRFTLVNLLAQLRVWLTNMYSTIEESESQARKDKALAHPEGEIEDSQASESQPIVRAAPDEVEHSLFVDELSVQYVNSKGQNNLLVPPSNQQQIMPPPEAPRDYVEHTNNQLLESPAPKSVTNLEGRQSKTPLSARKKIRHGFESIFEDEEDDDDDDDDDDEEHFQTDNRLVDKRKRAAISFVPKAKRTRIVESESRQAPPGSNASTSNSMPPPTSSMQSQPPNPSQPSQADFETIKLAKKQILSQQARVQSAPASRQRHVWSHHDCLLLLQLIRERHAAWSTIERNDGDKFEHPRNQQAYRDKARNMKVDYLITDAILPPCFDLIALGKKEIERLTSLGKNPYRKESDIGTDGQATNTEFMGNFNE